MDARGARGRSRHIANIPVMVDFGENHKERPMSELVTKKLRPGDIYTHCYSGLRNEQVDGKVNPAMFEARKRGVIFDVGHGGGSFAWRIAVPALKQGFPPDSISTDLHIGSMNSGMKDMDNLMSKFLVMGQSLKDVVTESTWNPAREIHHEELGNLSPGAIADVAVLEWRAAISATPICTAPGSRATRKSLRAHAKRWKSSLRSKRHHAPRLDHAAQRL